jgi:hypothetical protein
VSNRKVIGVGILGVVGYLAWKRGLFGGKQGLMSRADLAQDIVEENEIDACGNPSTSTYLYAQGGVASTLGTSMAPDMTNAQWSARIGGSATAIAAAINPIAGAVVGVASAVATTLFTVFAEAPPEPVLRLIIAEMPFNWKRGLNVPPGVPVYALDMCGYLHELMRGVEASGYSSREVIAVNWEVFYMIPKSTPIAHAAEIEGKRMPRPAAPDIIRGMLGNDARFYIGQEENLHGPWDPDAHVPPTAGSPAMWAEFREDYVPTYTPSPGEF